MPSRLPIIAGLLSGVLAAALIVVAIVVLAPDPAPAAPTRPSAGAPAVSPSPSAIPTASSGGPSASATSASASANGSAASANFHVGETAPPLRIPQVGGGTVDLAALRGRPVWVNFMRTDCPPCRDEFPVMNGFAARYASTNLLVVAVDIRESETIADDFARSLGATFPVGLDADGSAQSAWGAIVLPVHFWVDASGVIREGALGGIGPDLMAHGLSAILPGVNVTP
jgi:cytochrome c biogenesis protein CcmG/thiol:disulfide interchange protein DsbE